MKKILILLLFVWAGLPKGYGQKDHSGPINTGYVFIDGKFIEPPYEFKNINDKFYLNNILIGQTANKMPDPKELYKQIYRPYIPIDIDTNGGYQYLMSLRDTVFNVNFRRLALSYYYKYYSYAAAIDSVNEYLRKFPNLESLVYDSNDRLHYVFKNGEKKSLLSDRNMGYDLYNKIHKRKEFPYYNKELSDAQQIFRKIKVLVISEPYEVFIYNDLPLSAPINYIKITEDILLKCDTLINSDISPIQKENRIRDLLYQNGFDTIAANRMLVSLLKSGFRKELKKYQKALKNLKKPRKSLVYNREIEAIPIKKRDSNRCKG